MPDSGPISRAQAITEIAAQLADRISYVIIVGPAMVGTALAALAKLPKCRAYLDAGIDTVMTLPSEAALAAGSIISEKVLKGQVVAVVIVPKTVPATELSRALDYPVADDGSHDIITLVDSKDLSSTTDKVRVMWPMLFIDALARVEPKAAAQLLLNDVRRLS